MVSKDKMLAVLDAIAPKHLAMAWDNCGLLIDANEGYERLLICVDISEDVLQEAADSACDLIISHHPLIFDPLKRLDRDSTVYKAVQSGISVYAAHTNMDIVPGGLNDTLAEMLGIKNCRSLRDGDDAGFGCVGQMEKSLTVGELAHQTEKRLDFKGIRVSGALDRQVQTVAVACGAGGDALKPAGAAGAEVLLTGEAKHHVFREAAKMGITLLEAGHYHTEKHFVNLMAGRLQEAADTLEYTLQIITTTRETPPYVTII